MAMIDGRGLGLNSLPQWVEAISPPIAFRTPVIQSRPREVRSVPCAISLLMLVNFPQVAAIVWVTMLTWHDNTCGRVEARRWRIFALAWVARLLMYVFIVTPLFVLTARRRVRRKTLYALSLARNALDSAGMLLCLGAIWHLNAIQGCTHPEKSRLYQLCAGLVLVCFVQLVLPLLVVGFFGPFALAFCPSGFMDLMTRLQDPEPYYPASRWTLLNQTTPPRRAPLPIKLPTCKYKQVASAQFAGGSSVKTDPDTTLQYAQSYSSTSTLLEGGGPTMLSSHGQDDSASDEVAALIVERGDGGDGVEEEDTHVCAICIRDYMPEDEVRVLPCGHYFHTRCGDAWLRLHLNCPSCRATIPSERSNTHTPSSSTSGLGGYGAITRGSASARAPSRTFIIV